MSDSNPQPSRRDLFAPRSGTPDEGADQPTEYGPLFHFSANAMGCEFQVLCDETGRESLAGCVTDGFSLIADLEQQLSIFRPSSEMSAINRFAEQAETCDTQQVVEPTENRLPQLPVDPALFELLQTAQTIRQATSGAFDISATPLSRLWKECRQGRVVPDQAAIESVLANVGGQHIQLDAEAKSIGFRRSGLVLDLGGIGKGYALDRLREFLVMSNAQNFLIHGGQSSVIGCGSRSIDQGRGTMPWQVGISHPLSPGVRLATISLNDRAVGTSGSGRQSFVFEGKRYGHIIDPRTGWPADHFLSVTVLAEQAVQADALATAIFVAGPDFAEEICEQFGVSAITVGHFDDQRLAIDSINLAKEDWTLE